jgi:hypothetical protein
MSVIENRTNIRKRKKPLPLRIAIFVAMTSTYKVLTGIPEPLQSGLTLILDSYRHFDVIEVTGEEI